MSKTFFYIKAQQVWSMNWEDLQYPDGIYKLDSAFLDWLRLNYQELYKEILSYRENKYSRVEQSAFIMKLAPCLEEFWVLAFDVGESYNLLQKQLSVEEPVLSFRKLVFRNLKNTKEVSLDASLIHKLTSIANADDAELALAEFYLAQEADVQNQIVFWLSKHMPILGPEKIDWYNLFPTYIDDNGFKVHFKHVTRSGFDLTDHNLSFRQAQFEADYCIYCHKTQGDYCSSGFLNKKGHPNLGVRSSPLGEKQEGCPLNQHISEMNLLRRRGYIFAALAMIMVENPLCALTGYRICNDCSQACIYQKQTPVNIPMIETRTLKDILSIAYGAEWYFLLLQWNPLRMCQFLPKPSIDKRVLVFGLGPSGIASLYHLYMEGVDVVGFDGLNISQVPEKYIISPIVDMSWYEDLSKREQKGFGGVSEYGITSRWDKNFLTLPWIFFARLKIALRGGMRFGGTIKINDVWDMNFHHLVLALGAGLPNALNIPHSLAKGIRSANDFLMNLHLQGANHKNALTLMDVRMPCVVIGGGLTSVDAATELRAYYIHLIKRVKQMVDALDSYEFWKQWSEQDALVLQEWLQHAKLLEDGLSEHNLIESLGGVSIVYRKSLIESPAYRKNALELDHAMREGVKFLELNEPLAFKVDANDRVKSISLKNVSTEIKHDIFARTVLFAIGSQPNVAYEYEHAGSFVKQNGYYMEHENSMMTSYSFGHYKISYVGDLHPRYHGSVVRALASAKEAYPKILLSLAEINAPGSAYDLLDARLVDREILSPSLVKLKIYAPMHARNAQIGHFFRISSKTVPTLEALPLSVFAYDDTTLEFVLRISGVSSAAIANLQIGDFVSIMGPTGVRMRLHDQNETTCIIADAEGLPTALAMANAMVLNGISVYFCFINNDVLESSWLRKSCRAPCYNMPDNWEVEFFNMSLPWDKIKRVIIQGLAPFIKKVNSLRIQGNKLEKSLWVASVFGPMQCMLKGVCAECWQWQIDPITKKRTKAVFACSWQDQPLDIIDLDHLVSRQDANNILERLVHQYLVRRA